MAFAAAQALPQYAAVPAVTCGDHAHPRRNPAETPTLAEGWRPGYDVTIWYGMIAPGGQAEGRSSES